jgi:hypothetical protein
MNARTALSTLLVSAVLTACGGPTAPDADAVPGAAVSASANAIQAAGTFTQTGITSLQARSNGPNQLIEQTSHGIVSGTLSGTYTDDLRVNIHPNGTFNAHFTITCQCEVNGKQGTLEFVVNDRGRITGPTTAAFSGHAAILSGTGGLAGLRGVLEISGVVDLVTGLSTYSYSGRIR